MAYQPLMDSMSALVEHMHMLTGIAVAYGTKDDFRKASIGSIQEVEWLDGAFAPCVRPIREDTLYDLASLTKLFTLISVMQLIACGRLSLSDHMGIIDPRFSYLRQTSVRDVLCYEAVLKTPLRVDEQTDREAALRQVFATEVNPVEPARLYSDMNALVLKYIVEAAAGLPFFDYLRQNIFLPAGMTDTFARIPPERLFDSACYNYEYRIQGDKYILRTDAPIGTPHDPKARILSDGGSDLCGHAGLFSTLPDMVKLCQAILAQKLMPMDILREIGVNRTGRIGADGSYRQYLGYLCFSKSPAQRFSEVPQWMSGRAFGLSGFTGNHIAIDPDAGVFDLFLGNRCHNRVSVIQPPEGKDIACYGLTPEGEGVVEWTDGRKVQSSYLYIHQKDQKLHGPIREHMLELGWLQS
jgi:CubicO group peptidase (beta-lactamase class C family)